MMVHSHKVSMVRVACAGACVKNKKMRTHDKMISVNKRSGTLGVEGRQATPHPYSKHIIFKGGVLGVFVGVNEPPRGFAQYVQFQETRRQGEATTLQPQRRQVSHAPHRLPSGIISFRSAAVLFEEIGVRRDVEGLRPPVLSHALSLAPLLRHRNPRLPLCPIHT